MHQVDLKQHYIILILHFQKAVGKVIHCTPSTSNGSPSREWSKVRLEHLQCIMGIKEGERAGQWPLA